MLTESRGIRRDGNAMLDPLIPTGAAITQALLHASPRSQRCDKNSLYYKPLITMIPSIESVGDNEVLFQ